MAICNEQHLPSLFHSAPIGVVYLNAGREVVYGNPCASKLLGCEASGLFARSFDEYIHPKDLRGFLDFFDSQAPGEHTCRLVTSDGGEITATLRCTAPDDSGRLVYLSPASPTETSSEQRYQSLIANCPLCVLINDESGRFLEVNQKACDLLGYTHDELLQRTIFDIVHPNDLEKAKNALRSQIETGEAHCFARCVRKDGEDLWLAVNGVTTDDGDLVSFCNDITEYMASRRRLEIDEERKQLALHASRVGIWDWNIETGEVFLSDHWFTMLGYEPDELPHALETWSSLMHPDDLPHAQKLIEHSIANGESYEIRFRMKCKCGDWKWIHARGQSVDETKDGKAVRMAGTHLDIDNQVRLEQRLRESEQRLNLALEGAQDGIWDWFVDSGETYYSDRWYAMLGYKPGELPMNYNTWEALVHPDDLQHSLAAIRQSIETGEPYQFSSRLRCKDGSWKWILDRGGPVEKSAEGEILRMAGAHTDIENQVAMEKRLRESETRYRQLFENANDGILLMKGPQFVTANRHAARLYGCTVEKLIASTPMDFSPPFQDDGQPSDKKALAQIQRAEQGEMITFEWLHKQLDGTPFYADVTLSSIDLNDGKHVMAIVRDISERKKYELKLAASERRWRLMTEQSPYPTLIMTPDGRVQSMNHAWFELWDFDPVTTDLSDFLIFKDPQLGKVAELETAWRLAFEGKTSHIPLTTFDPALSGMIGRKRHVNTWLYPITDENQELTSIVIIHQDITQQIIDADAERARKQRNDMQRNIVLQVAKHPALHDGDVDALADFAAQQVLDAFDIDRCSLWLFEDDFWLVSRLCRVKGKDTPVTAGMRIRTVDYPSYHEALMGARAVAADNVFENPQTSEFSEDYSQPSACKSLLDSPIRMSGKLVGVISLEHYVSFHDWSADEINFASELADQIAQAMLNQQRRRQEEIRKCLYRIAHAAETETTPQRLYIALHNVLKSVVPIHEFDIFLNLDSNKLNRVFHYSSPARKPSNFTDVLAVGEAVRTSGKACLYIRTESKGDFRELFEKLDCASAIAQPLQTGDRVFGLLLLQTEDESHGYSDNDLGLLRFVATEIAHAINKMQQESVIKQHRQRLALAIEGGELGLWDWRVLDGSLSFNETWAGMLGYRVEELTPSIKTWENLLHPDDRLEVLDGLHQHLKGETESMKTDYRLRTKSGDYIWVQSRGKVVERNADGGALRMAGTNANITKRKLAEIDRDRLFNLSVDMFSVVAFNGFFTQVNPSWTRNLGWSAQELLAKPFIEYVAEEDRQRTQQALDRLIKGKPVLFFENRFQCKSGATRWLSWNSFPLPDEHVIFSVVRDITESIAAKQTLQESEERYRNIIDATPMGIHSYELNENDVLIFTGANRSAEEMLGLNLNKEIGKTLQEVYPGIEEDMPDEFVAIAKHGGMYERTNIAYNESELTAAYEIYAFQTKQNAISVMFLDITKRMVSENEARRLRNLLQNIINSMPSVLIGVDGKGEVTQWNQQARNLTGLSEDEAAGRLLVDIIPQLGSEIDRIQESLRLRKVMFDAKRPMNVHGEKRFADLTVYPLISNGIEGAVIRLDDVTERVRIEEMMVQSEKMLTVGGLAAGMAHEINNPLAGIMQNVQVIHNRLLGELKKNETVAAEIGLAMEKLRLYLERRDIPAMLAAVIESGARASHIVRNMLDFSRKSEQQKAPHPLADIVDSAVELASNEYDLKKQYDFRQIHIERDYQNDIPAVHCERGMVLQVLLNILKNGAQAMAGKTYIDEEPTFKLQLLREDDMVVLRITDNGPGIDEQTRRHIFEPFYTTKGVGRGTGLGLSVSYFIITENHQGSLEVESRLGEGATFIVRLPIGG